MSTINLLPLAGINNVEDDDALRVGGDAPRLYVRDAVNVDITPTGKPKLRAGVTRVSVEPLENLWHSELHSDTFATRGDQWVLVNTVDWGVTPLCLLGVGDVSHQVVNSAVLVAGPAGIFTYKGQGAEKLTIDTPAAPWANASEGSMTPGSYGVAVSWLRGKVESAPSAITHVQVVDGGIDITFPACYDLTVTHVRLYFTKPDGGELMRGETYTIDNLAVSIPLLPQLGAAPQFLHCDPMPTGRYLCEWRGRLLTAKANVLRFSEALAFHIHDQRHGFIQFGQRITFLAPVDGGIWVGQRDHVLFLQGNQPDNLEQMRRSARAPVPGSLVYLDADSAGQYDQGGAATVLWLADNGYVAGTASGQVIENNAGTLKGVTAERGTSVVLGDRVLTVVA